MANRKTIFRGGCLLLFSGLMAAVGFGSPQTQNPTPTAPPAVPASKDPATPQPADGKKPKKVWTNENLPQSSGSVSVVGNTTSEKYEMSKPADPSYVESVRKQLVKLQADIADADKQLAELKNFNEGEPAPATAVQLHKNYNRDPIDVQISTLQTKKKTLQAKIDALLDEARQKGVEPGQLR